MSDIGNDIVECQHCGHQCVREDMGWQCLSMGTDYHGHVYGDDGCPKCKNCGTVDPDLRVVGHVETLPSGAVRRV